MNANAISIRAATPDDRPQMVMVINEAFAIETFLEGTRTDEVRLSAMMESGTFMVAEDDGKIGASIYVETRGSRGYIGMLAVDPALQGKGLGRAMIQAAEDYCRVAGCVAMDLVVLSLRPDLPPRYRKLGYAETGTEEFTPTRRLKDGMQCHAILMSKTL
jgi:ribosomal protein S18 acetylase RimI-like enzyme